MPKLFSNRKLVIVIVCIVLAALLINFSLLSRHKNSDSPLQKGSNDVIGSLVGLVAAPVNGVNGIGTNFQKLTNAYAENQYLQSKVDSLAQTKATNKALIDENRQLKNLLHLKNIISNYKLKMANVVTRAPSSWQNILTINKGSSDGLQKNQAVLAGKGFIGRISEANDLNSKVELLSNNDENMDHFAVQVVDAAGHNVNGIITDYDNKTNKIIIGNIISKNAGSVRKGDQVMTSGLGGSIPKGLLIGTVDSVEKGYYGLNYKIKVNPATDINNINEVGVATSK